MIKIEHIAASRAAVIKAVPDLLAAFQEVCSKRISNAGMTLV
jgi:hypothetical protein